MSKVEYVGKKSFAQEIGFWLALIVAIIQWVIVFIMGMIR